MDYIHDQTIKYKKFLTCMYLSRKIEYTLIAMYTSQPQTHFMCSTISVTYRNTQATELNDNQLCSTFCLVQIFPKPLDTFIFADIIHDNKNMFTRTKPDPQPIATSGYVSMYLQYYTRVAEYLI